MPSITTVIAHAVYAAAATLEREALQDGLVFGDLMSRVLTGEPKLETDWLQAVEEAGQENNASLARHVNWAATRLVKAGWLYRGGRRWQLTGIGRDALNHWTDPVDFYAEAGRRYQRWKRNEHSYNIVSMVLEQLPGSGRWVELNQLADEFKFGSAELGGLLRGGRPTGWYLALGQDGQAGAGLPLLPHERDTWRRLLDEEGVLDEGRSSEDIVRARPDRRLAVWEAVASAKQLRMLGEDLDAEDALDAERPRQLWIIRGVDAGTGAPLIRSLWRERSVVTLDTTGFPVQALTAHASEAVRKAIDTALPATAPARRDMVARELDAFLNRVREGDIVLSMDGYHTYVGVVRGPVEHGPERLERRVD